MHFALPPRKTSNPPPYAPRQSRLRLPTARRLQNLGLVAAGFLTIIYLVSLILPARQSPAVVIGDPSHAPAGTPPIIIITPLDHISYPAPYADKIKENRVAYAKAHGYTTFFPAMTDYDLRGAPSSWSRIPAVRHAMTLYPYTPYFFHIDQHALIMNQTLRVEDWVLAPARLEQLMLRGQSIVPPESVIKTFPQLTASQASLILTQDGEGLSQGCFILRQGEWSRFFLDAWFEPLYRTYNFQKAENHALEHLVQWHSTVLSKLALIPQRILNSYYRDTSRPGGNALYSDGDFIINFSGCDSDTTRKCETEMQPFYELWKAGGREAQRTKGG